MIVIDALIGDASTFGPADDAIAQPHSANDSPQALVPTMASSSIAITTSRMPDQARLLPRSPRRILVDCGSQRTHALCNRCLYISPLLDESGILLQSESEQSVDD